MGYFIFGVVGAMWHESRILHRALLKASGSLGFSPLGSMGTRSQVVAKRFQQGAARNPKCDPTGLPNV